MTATLTAAAVYFGTRANGSTIASAACLALQTFVALLVISH